MIQKRWGGIFLVFVLLLALAGCGDTDQKAGGGADSQEKAATIPDDAAKTQGDLEDGADKQEKTADKPEDAAEKTTDSNQSGAGRITMEEAKTIVLENIGISEEEIQFVQVQLNTENGLSQYELELVGGTAKYEYKVDAATGEILSMNCEEGQGETGADPSEVPGEADMSGSETNTGTSQTTEQNGTQGNGDLPYNHNPEYNHHGGESYHNSGHWTGE